MEVDKVENVQKVIENVLERYNDSNERTKLSLMLFNQLNRLMLKILRVIQIPGGHLINVALKGYGLNQVMKLVTFAAGHYLHHLEVYDNYGTDEWHTDLKKCLAYCASDDKPITLYVDEYKMMDNQFYHDL